AKAVDLLWSARRVLVISGRGARGAGPELVALLDRLGAVYLDTGESRGLVSDSHPSVVGAMRGAVMGDADVILTIGRRLDFQLAYGSPAVFQSAKFVRIGDTPAEMRDNRRGAVEILASPAETLRAMVEYTGNRVSKVDRLWAAKLRTGHEQRAKKLQESMASAANGSDGRLHPNKVLSALQQAIGNDSVVITDGGAVPRPAGRAARDARHRRALRLHAGRPGLHLPHLPRPRRGDAAELPGEDGLARGRRALPGRRSAAAQGARAGGARAG